MDHVADGGDAHTLTHFFTSREIFQLMPLMACVVFAFSARAESRNCWCFVFRSS